MPQDGRSVRDDFSLGNGCVVLSEWINALNDIHGDFVARRHSI